MIKRLVIILLGIVLIANGCVTGQKDNTGDQNLTIEQVVDYDKDIENKKPAEILCSLINEDKKGDKKSVYWDGTSAKIRENNDDANDRDDGKYIEAIKPYKAEDLIAFNYPMGLEQVDIIDDQPDICHFTGKNVDIFICPIDYEEESERLDESVNYSVLESMGIREDTLYFFKDYKTYVGIKKLNESEEAGFALLFINDSEIANRSYKVEVYGMGNMDYVKEVALTVMNSFRVLLPSKG